MKKKMLWATNIAFVIFICFYWSLSCCATDGCPVDCTCRFFESGLEDPGHLSLSCPDGQAAELDNVGTREIDDMLANNTQLKGLDITVSSLAQVPSGVCNLTSLKGLILNDNKLVALPDDCLSRLSQLTIF